MAFDINAIKDWLDGLPPYDHFDFMYYAENKQLFASKLHQDIFLDLIVLSSKQGNKVLKIK